MRWMFIVKITSLGLLSLATWAVTNALIEANPAAAQQTIQFDRESDTEVQTNEANDLIVTHDKIPKEARPRPTLDEFKQDSADLASMFDDIQYVCDDHIVFIRADGRFLSRVPGYRSYFSAVVTEDATGEVVAERFYTTEATEYSKELIATYPRYADGFELPSGTYTAVVRLHRLAPGFDIRDARDAPFVAATCTFTLP